MNDDLSDKLFQQKKEFTNDSVEDLKQKIRYASDNIKPAQRKDGIISIRFGNQDVDKVVMEVIDAWRKKNGYTWKIMMVRGIAEMAASEGNSALAETLVDYMIHRKR